MGKHLAAVVAFVVVFIATTALVGMVTASGTARFAGLVIASACAVLAFNMVSRRTDRAQAQSGR